MKYKLGIIGAGVMANSIIDCAIEKKAINPDQTIAYDTDIAKLETINKKGIHIAETIQQLVQNSDIVLLSVKPQHYSQILENNDFTNTSTIISIMAGVKISTIRSKLCISNCGIARVMPNTPCKVGKGFCGICYDNVNETNKDFISKFFASCGETLLITEDMFDTITSISGSGPAYVYMFINGMIKGGIEGGLSYDSAKKIAISTMIGASELAKSSDMPLDKLVDMVCSKGGTTIEAVNIYRQKQLEQTIAEGIAACRNKSKLLSEML